MKSFLKNFKRLFRLIDQIIIIFIILYYFIIIITLDLLEVENIFNKKSCAVEVIELHQNDIKY